MTTPQLEGICADGCIRASAGAGQSREVCVVDQREVVLDSAQVRIGVVTVTEPGSVSGRTTRDICNAGVGLLA